MATSTRASPSRATIDLEPDYVTRLLGVAIPRSEIVRILRALEFGVSDNASNAGTLRVSVPSYRLDVNIPADLVEEIGRIYGYDRLPSTLLEDELPPQRRNLALEGETKVRDILTGCGLDEVITYSMINPADDAQLLQGPPAEGYVKVLNPLSAERSHLRRTLLPNLLDATRANLRFRERIAIFELGRVFYPRPGQTLPAEPRRLSAVLVGPREAGQLAAARRHATGLLRSKGRSGDPAGPAGGAQRELGARRASGDAPRADGAVLVRGAGRGARRRAASAGTRRLGSAGASGRADGTGPGRPAGQLGRGDADDGDIRPAGGVRGPGAHRGRGSLPAAQVAGLIRQTGGKTLVDLRLFDVYRGQPVPDGKKSLAYNLAFQAPDRTLTDDDVRKLRHKIVQRLERELGATLRA